MAKARQCVFPRGEAMRASINIRLVRAGLYSSDISGEGTWDWDRPHCVCASYTPLDQVGYVIVLINTDLRKNIAMFCSALYECTVENNVNPDRVFFSQVKNKPHDGVHICVFLLELGAVVSKSCPDLSVLFLLFCPGASVPAAFFSLSWPVCPVHAFLFLKCHVFPVLSVLSCPSCHVVTDLPWLFLLVTITDGTHCTIYCLPFGFILCPC